MSLLGLLAAYLIGAIPVGYVVARFRGGVDIRRAGGGSIGGTDGLGTWIGPAVLTLVGDIVKATSRWAPHARSGPRRGAAAARGRGLGQLLAGVPGVPRRHGRGQWARGLPDPGPVGGMAAGLWILVTALSRYVSLASIVACVSRRSARRSVTRHAVVAAAVVAAIIVWRHRANIVRLASGSDTAWASAPGPREPRRRRRRARPGGSPRRRSWGTALAIHLGRVGCRSASGRAIPRSPTPRAPRGERTVPPQARPAGRGDGDRGRGRALAGVAIVLIAVPSHFVETVLTRVADHVAPRAVLVSATKGIEPRHGLRISQLLADRLPGRVVAVLSGPSFAREVAPGRPAAMVVACADEAVAAEPSASWPDRPAALHQPRRARRRARRRAQNVMAIATGLVDGSARRENARAALVTRGLAEIVRLGTAAGAQPTTFAGWPVSATSC